MTGRGRTALQPAGTPLGDLPLRPGTIDALRFGGVLTLEELRTMGDRELRTLRRFGPVALADVRSVVPPPDGRAGVEALPGRAGMSPAPTPAARRVRLLRDLDEACGRAWRDWPGEPPPWLDDLVAEVDRHLHAAEEWLARLRPARLRPAGEGKVAAAGRVAALPDGTLVENLPLRQYTVNALRAGGVLTLGDLRAMGDDDLLRLRLFGRGSLSTAAQPSPSRENILYGSLSRRRRGVHGLGGSIASTSASGDLCRRDGYAAAGTVCSEWAEGDPWIQIQDGCGTPALSEDSGLMRWVRPEDLLLTDVIARASLAGASACHR